MRQAKLLSNGSLYLPPRLRFGWFKIKIKIKKIKELMLKAFKEGQECPLATNGIIKIWINEELY